MRPQFSGNLHLPALTLWRFRINPMNAPWSIPSMGAFRMPRTVDTGSVWT
jgi:hypothetical protein